MERAKVTKEDTLIFLERLRRWLEPISRVLDYLIELNTTNNCVFIRGNHDELLLHWLRDSKDNLMWYKHGGDNCTYEKVNSVTKQLHVDFLSLKIIISTKRTVFCSRGIYQHEWRYL
jgi:serine/threonine protein phosphatase 1